mgnify:FL=1|tara:strand:+ start:1962 stop:2555 length:594 start_codon:yes stop_codon:yes gene_type:complete
MDEVTYLVTLLDEYWNTAVAALGSAIPAIHRVKPQIMDIRSMASTRNDSQPGRGGNRIRISSDSEVTADGITPSLDVIAVMQNSQTIEYPTRDWSVRNETHEMSVSIRTKQDKRKTNDNARITPSGSTFGRDRIENLYKIVRYIIETNRRGWFRNAGTLEENIKHLVLGSRTDSNDKKSRIFGYRINVTMKRFANSL